MIVLWENHLLNLDLNSLLFQDSNCLLRKRLHGRVTANEQLASTSGLEQMRRNGRAVPRRKREGSISETHYGYQRVYVAQGVCDGVSEIWYGYVKERQTC